MLCECLVYDSITELSLIFHSHIPVPIEIPVIHNYAKQPYPSLCRVSYQSCPRNLKTSGPEVDVTTCIIAAVV